VIVARGLQRLSALFVAVERALLSLLVAAIALFVLTNVLLRMVGTTLAWADEIAVHAMILSGFVGASLMLRGRIDPAVLLLHEMLPPRGVRVLRVVISTLAVGFGIVLIHLCWRWFDPLGLIRAGFDVPAFEMATFNFVYTDTTPVLGASSFWFYLIVPWFGLTLTIHAAANLVEDLGAVPRVENPIGTRAADV
jgi:TRAP-type C4-dicarboxylate transport system permease small subunit